MPDEINSNYQDAKSHWESVYKRQPDEGYSWHQQIPQESLDYILAANLSFKSEIIDIGAGASSLVDHLLVANYENVTVLDISETALSVSKERLGKAAELVRWYTADVRQFHPDRQYDLWHDRAVFHFLTSRNDRQLYKQSMKNALVDGGHLILATFAPEGPKRCSGLDIVQYDAQSISKELGNCFTLQQSKTVLHKTPSDNKQRFNYYRFIYNAE